VHRREISAPFDLALVDRSACFKTNQKVTSAHLLVAKPCHFSVTKGLLVYLQA
jgi:hypothetical protein